MGALVGAKAGIMMKANPELGSPANSEGFVPAPYFWDDWAMVCEVGERTCVPVDCFDDVLVTDEFEPRKAGAHQLKYYARGIGNIRTGWRGSDPDREVLVLAKSSISDRRGWRQEPRGACARESTVYGRTGPAEPRTAEG